MRKITLNPNFGNQTVPDWNHNRIVVKEGNQVQEFKAEKSNKFFPRYSPEQLLITLQVNHVLTENQQAEMTDEEIEHLLEPFGKKKNLTPEDLQMLAGFRVEKTIVKIGD